MKTRKRMIATILLLCSVLLCACGDAYSEYATAYNKLSANGGVNADMTAVLTMDGETTTYKGNFKVDSKNNLLYYELSSGGSTTTQFSDGKYLYTSRGDEKIKYSLGSSKPSGAPAENGNGEQPEQGAPEFDSSEFLSEFASFLEAGKIKELGLLDPIAKAAVSKTSKSGDTYTLTVSDSIVKRFVNTMAVNEAGTGDTVQVKDLKNFKYTATVKNGYVTGTVYSGDVTLEVPASLMSSGSAKEYTLSFKINIDFVNPGQAVSITLPNTAEYREVSY